MGWLERADQHQQRVADDTRRDGIEFAKGSKTLLALWLSISVLVLVVLFMAALAKTLAS